MFRALGYHPGPSPFEQNHHQPIPQKANKQTTETATPTERRPGNRDRTEPPGDKETADATRQTPPGRSGDSDPERETNTQLKPNPAPEQPPDATARRTVLRHGPRKRRSHTETARPANRRQPQNRNQATSPPTATTPPPLEQNRH